MFSHLLYDVLASQAPVASSSLTLCNFYHLNHDTCSLSAVLLLLTIALSGRLLGFPLLIRADPFLGTPTQFSSYAVLLLLTFSSTVTAKVWVRVWDNI